MLRLLFDQHAGGELYDRLAANDAFDIERVRDIDSLGPSADDEDIWRYAVASERVVLTNGKHFVDGTADPDNGTHPGVIRFLGHDWATIAQAIETIERSLSTEDIAQHGLELYVPGEWIG